jgi:hypothetical protein
MKSEYSRKVMHVRRWTPLESIAAHFGLWNTYIIIVIILIATIFLYGIYVCVCV